MELLLVIVVLLLVFGGGGYGLYNGRNSTAGAPFGGYNPLMLILWLVVIIVLIRLLLWPLLFAASTAGPHCTSGLLGC